MCGCGWCVSGGTGHWVVRRPAGWAGVGVYGLLMWVRPLLENCIVDASIFEILIEMTGWILECSSLWWVVRGLVGFLGFCDCSVAEVFKGTLVDALALGAEEGRCSLR